MSFVQEFKDFAVKGNAIEMAVGIVIGAAFTKIVNSLVNDVIMPPLGKLMGNADFSQFALALGEGPDGKPILLRYGVFVNTVVDFLIVALAIFIVVKQMNRLKRQEPDAAKA